MSRYTFISPSASVLYTYQQHEQQHLMLGVRAAPRRRRSKLHQPARTGGFNLNEEGMHTPSQLPIIGASGLSDLSGFYHHPPPTLSRAGPVSTAMVLVSSRNVSGRGELRQGVCGVTVRTRAGYGGHHKLWKKGIGLLGPHSYVVGGGTINSTAILSTNPIAKLRTGVAMHAQPEQLF